MESVMLFCKVFYETGMAFLLFLKLVLLCCIIYLGTMM